MSRCTERRVIATAIGENTGLDDLRRVEVLHTIARAIIDGVLLVPSDIHEDFPTRVVAVANIELRICSREVIAENFVGCGNVTAALPFDAPGLVVDLLPSQWLTLRARAEFLNVLRKIGDRVPSRLPSGHLQIDRRERVS